MQKQRRAPPPTHSGAPIVEGEETVQGATVTDPAFQAYLLQTSMGNQFLAEQIQAQSADAGGGGRELFAPTPGGGEQDPIDRARALTSLPGATAGDHSDFGVAQYEKIEQRSQRDTYWNKTFQHMDADHSLGFTMDPAGPDARGSTPIHMGEVGEDQRTNEATHLAACNGIDTLAEYRKMLQRDFNFSGLINKYAGARPDLTAPEELRSAGESAFVADVIARFYPDNQVGDPEVAAAEAIAKNIWSYATCGYDLNGVTDIAQMQGLLYVFDKEIRQSSDTNTKMKGEWFVVPGTEDWDTPIKLKGGDGRHGRATILTTRHLLAGMSETPPETELTGFDESYLLLDRSGSMQTDEFSHLADLLEVGGIDGELHLAGYDDTAASLKKVENGDALTQDEAVAALSLASEEAAAVNNKEMADFDQADPALTHRGRSTREQGLAAALAWAKGLPEDSDTRRQMLVVTDEPDFNPTVLADLQAEAKKKNLSVKVLYSFNSQSPGSYGAGNADSYVIVDVMAIEELLDHWLVPRQDTQQLDWMRVAASQHAEVKRW